MKKIVLLMLITFLSLSFISDVQAKRFGGGRSFGTTRSAANFSRSATSHINQPFSRAKSWLAPLAGLALGGLLASLFMGHGLASGLFTWLVLLSILFFIFAWMRKRFQPALSANNQYTSYQTSSNRSPFIQATSSAQRDHDEFLRNAKATFLRLQTAYDTKNLNDIRQFTTPEVFGEIQLQLQERGEASNITEVISLQAELADPSDSLLSVRFTGSIKEELQQGPQSFTEIWHFEQDTGTGQWRVAGIQQEYQGEKFH